MDSLFRIFMFILPFAICFAAYIWIGRRAWKAPNGVAKIIALLFVLGGAGYTFYKLIGSVGTMMTNDNFEFAIIIIMVFVLAFASIAITIAEPEKE